jgi:myo-inositol-1(or 4)-monophosphatase
MPDVFSRSPDLPISNMAMENHLDIAIEIAREAGGLLLEHFRQPLQITYKRRSDLVTEADRRSETLIVERLQSHFPDHAIVAEEGGGQKTGSDYCWYVDPLDGTTNFAHGFPVFSVTLGLAYRGEVVAGVVYDPTRDELFAAECGAGAFLNGQRLRVSSTGDLAECLLATGFPVFATNHDLNIEFYFCFTQLSHGIRRAGSAALDLCSVAAGRFDGFWELKLNPWDKAAGTLLVTEAGGLVSGITGKPFNLLGDDIFASNGLVHDQMLRVFSEILEQRRSGGVRR